MKTINELREVISQKSPRSAWDKGLREYALELLDDLPANVDYGSIDSLKTDMLNGASDWEEYSYDGSSLIYDCDIAERLCTPSELKKNRNGERRPNAKEEWLDTQARALNQAARMIIRLAK